METRNADAPRETSIVRRLLIGLLVALLLGAAFFGGAVVTAGMNLFRSDTATSVRPTPSVVIAIRDLANLETTSFHMERVIDLKDTQSRFKGMIEAEDAILLVAAADITAGVDLSQLSDDDVDADPESGRITITLPPAKLLATRLDNERTYVHTRETDVLAERSEDLETRARQEAESALEQAAKDAGILDRAAKNAKRTVESLLHSLGYEDVEVIVR